MKLAWKLAIPQICIIVCLGLISFVVIGSSLVAMRDEYANNIIRHSFQRITNGIETSMQEAAGKAALLANLPTVIDAYEVAHSGNIDDAHSPQSQAARETLRKEFRPGIDNFKAMTGQTSQVHFHLANGYSLTRVWLDKQIKIGDEWVDISDDLRAFRPMVMDVNKSGLPAMGIEVGRSGFVIRGIVPIKAPDGRQLGSVEAISDFDKVLDAAKEEGEVEIALYANKEAFGLALNVQDETNNQEKGDFVRLTPAMDDEIESLITTALLARGKDKSIFEKHGSIFLATLPIYDYKGERVGVIVCAMHTAVISDFAKAAGITMTLMLIGMAVVPSLSLLFGARRMVTNPLNKVKEKIQDIAEEHTDLIEQISIQQKDEIGDLVKWFNAMTSKINVMVHGLREADDRMHSLLDAMPFCAHIIDRDCNILYCNEMTIRMFELSSKQEYQNRFFDFSPECQPCGKNSRELALEYIGKALEEGCCQLRWMHKKLDGEPIPSEVTLVRIGHREGYILAAYTLDLREREAAMASLAAEKERFEATSHWYHSILDAIPLPVAVQDVDEQWAFVNAPFENLTGKKLEELIGLPCNSSNIISICNTENCAIACAKRGLRKTHWFNDDRTYQINIEILQGLHDETIGYIEVIQDLTELERLAKQRTEAEAANTAKSAFLATMSHEIRTPMNVILGVTEMQLQNETLSQDTKDAFSRIYTSGYTLLGIINDILDLSKIESGKMELMPARYETASLINDTVQLNATRFASKPIDFRLEVDRNLPSKLFGDELRIKQIMNNLLSNAFKYTEEGEVVLSFSADCEDENSMTTLVISVRDTGQGMTEEQVSHLFESYIRFNLETNRAIEGTGLGMSITRQLAHMMGGEISVESEPRKGTLFTVRLPQKRIGDDKIGRELAENLQQFKADTTSMKSRPIARKLMTYGKVLIVDDLETNLFVGKGLMSPYGLSIDTVTSGLEAINKIRDGNEYDIIFMDHMMPGMDGVEATRILRDMGYTRPIVALTANAVAGQAEMFLKNGFDDFISKPIDLRRLDALLNRLIHDAQSPEAIKAARLQKYGVKAEDSKPSSAPLSLTEIFIRDAEKAIATLEAIYKNNFRRGNDMQMFIVNTHALKSALLNIGEPELSSAAFSLEQMGRKQDMAAISANTNDFLEALRAVVAKIAPKKEDGDDDREDEDPVFLREKLETVQTACAGYDKKAAKEALAELKQKAWSKNTREQLGIIARHLLHSDFEEAAVVAKTLCPALSNPG